MTNESTNKTVSENKKPTSCDTKETKTNIKETLQKTKITREALLQNMKGKGIPLEKKLSLEKVKENFLAKKTLNLACYKALMNDKRLGAIDEVLPISKVKSILQNLQLKERNKLMKPDSAK